MKEIVHVTRCTGRTFTREQWSEYNRNHTNMGTTSVTVHDRFDFNVFDVCINPETITFRIDQQTYAMVSLCVSSVGLWSYGLSCSCNKGGCSLPAVFADGKEVKGYKRRDECLHEAVKAARIFLSRYDNNSDVVRLLKMLDDELRKAKAIQLELFG